MFIPFDMNGHTCYVSEEQFIDYRLINQQTIFQDNKTQVVDVYEIILDNNTMWSMPLKEETINILKKIKEKRTKSVDKN